jgi:hypothetical protein
MWKTQDRADLGERVAVAVAVAVIAVTGMGAVAGAGMAVTGRRKLTNVIDVGSWAIGPGNVGPRPRRNKPM